MAIRRIRTGPTSFLNLDDADERNWRAAGNREYAEGDVAGVDLAEEQAHQDAAPAEPNEAKAVSGPAENKARRAPAETKAR